MNKLRNLTIINFGMFLLMAGVLLPVRAGAQTSDVNVVNTPSVNVANRVALVPGTTVGINSANNTVKIDPAAPVTVRGEKTEVIYNQALAAESQLPALTPLVDVSAYKQIRIAVAKEGNGSAWITPFLYFGTVPDAYFTDRVQFDNYFENFMNKVYDTPGQFVRVQIQGTGNFRVVVYGRRN